jgi:hypothetical protein
MIKTPTPPPQLPFLCFQFELVAAHGRLLCCWRYLLQVVHRSHIMSFSGGLVEWSDDDYSSAYAESLLVDFCYDGGRVWV